MVVEFHLGSAWPRASTAGSRVAETRSRFVSRRVRIQPAVRRTCSSRPLDGGVGESGARHTIPRSPSVPGDEELDFGLDLTPAAQLEVEGNAGPTSGLASGGLEQHLRGGVGDTRQVLLHCSPPFPHARSPPPLGRSRQFLVLGPQRRNPPKKSARRAPETSSAPGPWRWT